MRDILKLLPFFVDGGAWSFSARGLTCQVYSGNARDLGLLNRHGCFGTRDLLRESLDES